MDRLGDLSLTLEMLQKSSFDKKPADLHRVEIFTDRLNVLEAERIVLIIFSVTIISAYPASVIASALAISALIKPRQWLIARAMAS